MRATRRNLDLWIMAAALIVGGLLRLLYLAELTHAPDFDAPLLDEQYHDYWARCIAFGESTLREGTPDPGISTNPYFRPPGYPFFLALVYKVFGTHPLSARIIQMVLGLLSCALGYVFTRRWFGRGPARFYAVIMAVSWVFMYYEGKLLAASLLMPLTLLLLHLLARLAGGATARKALAAGLALGAYALVRPNILPFAAVAAVWVWWVAIRQVSEKKYLRATRAVAALTLGTILAIAPATIRNYVVGREFVLISANGGINLFFGNNEDTTGVDASHAEIGPWTCFDYPGIVADLEKRLGKPLSYGSASAYFARRAWDFVAQNPAAALRLTLRKTALFWGPSEIAAEGDVALERKQSAVLRYLPVSFSWAMALSLVGMGMLFVEWRQAKDRHWSPIPLLLVAFAAVFSATIVIFFVAGRYRLPVIPVLLMFSAVALHRIGLLLLGGDLHKALVWCLIAPMLYAASQAGRQTEYTRPHAWHLHRGIAFETRNELERALREYHMAEKSAPNDPLVLYSLGQAYLRKQSVATAVSYLTRAVESDPGHVRARLALGKALGRQRQWQAAAEQFSKALDLSPGNAEAHLCAGSALMMLGRGDDAIKHYRETVRLQPDYVAARLCLGSALLEHGHIDDAKQHFRAAMRIDPGNHAAREGLRKADAGAARRSTTVEEM